MLQSLTQILATAISLFACALLMHSGIQKLRPSLKQYYLDVFSGYGLELKVAQAILRPTIGLVELFIATLILVPNTASRGLLAGAAFIAFYGLAMARVLIAGKIVDCGCSGPNKSTTVTWKLVMRNFFIACAFSFSSTAVAISSWFHTATALLLALFISFIYLSVEQLFSNQIQLNNIRQLRKF